MPVTDAQIEEAVRIAREYGATRVVLFGSAMDCPEHARDLDLAVDGVEGWEFFRLGARIDRALGLPVDLVPLDPSTPFSRHVERWGRTLFHVA
ncbi:nucleotidyltransferase family protein [Rubrivirga sp.]|uniref:nucleotidyltransferase family protein n=1 Tax=Rubrivirga sp. TaxID=1885344 RepID=UPI003B52A4FC